MSKNIRIIPRLDIKGADLVKGIHLEGLRVLGKPEEFAAYYYECGADELLYMDVVASLFGRNSLHGIISRIARETYIPLIVGGGLRTIEDIAQVLRVGADKVSLNTEAIKNPKMISEAARKFGSSTILISIETIKQADGRYLAYTDNGREFTGVEVLEWAKRVEELGAGEILLTSVDRDGTGKGYDVELTKMVSDAVAIPVISGGGCGSLQDVEHVITAGHADAVTLASVLHYDRLKRFPGTVPNLTGEGNMEYLKSGKSFSKISPVNLCDLKSYLVARGINCRHSVSLGKVG